MSLSVRERVGGAGGYASLPDLLTCAVTRRLEDLEANLPIATEVVRQMGGARLGDIDREELGRRFGLDDFEVERVVSAIELGRRSANAAKGLRQTAYDPKSAHLIFEDLGRQQQERFEAATFNAKRELIRRFVVHIGTGDRSLVSARDVFREAVRDGALSIIVAHNHPSGNPEPSPQDIEITQALKQAGDLLEISVDDHLIIVRDGYLSLKEKGLM